MLSSDIQVRYVTQTFLVIAEDWGVFIVLLFISTASLVSDIHQFAIISEVSSQIENDLGTRTRRDCGEIRGATPEGGSGGVGVCYFRLVQGLV